MKRRRVGARTHDAAVCRAVQDYLAAPMPFLVGLHAPNLFAAALRSSSLEEVVVVDLDRGTVRVAFRNPRSCNEMKFILKSTGSVCNGVAVQNWVVRAICLYQASPWRCSSAPSACQPQCFMEF